MSPSFGKVFLRIDSIFLIYSISIIYCLARILGNGYRNIILEIRKILASVKTTCHFSSMLTHVLEEKLMNILRNCSIPPSTKDILSSTK